MKLYNFCIIKKFGSLFRKHHHQNSKAGRYKANGVLVSGPCGSTAFNMNAGGAIVDPSVKCMQILMIAPTTLGSRPIILGKNTTVNLFFHKKAKVFSDGILIGSFLMSFVVILTDELKNSLIVLNPI